MRLGTSSVTPPTKSTLRKYGLTLETWQQILDLQGGTCGACGKVPRTGRLNIDHAHVRGWSGMPTAERVRFVRGLLCWSCNSFRLARGATVANLRGAADYLERYEHR
jgi:hypothetical protein